MKLASAGPLAAGAPPVTHAIAARPERRLRRPAPWWRRPRRPTGPKLTKRRKWPNNAAAAGQSRHRTRVSLAYCLASSLTQAPAQAKPVAGLGLCRSDVARPAAGLATAGLATAGLATAGGATAGHTTERRDQAGRPGRSPHRLDHPGRRAGKAKAKPKQRIDLARNKASSLLSKADPFTEPVEFVKAKRRCSAPVSPASSANRPKRSAGHSSAPIFPALPFATDPFHLVSAQMEKPAPHAPALLFPTPQLLPQFTLWQRSIDQTKTSRQEIAVRILRAWKDRPRRATAGDTGLHTENDTERSSRSVALVA